ncbi:kinase-like domain-containing protein, partial [Zopfochytrium polystomum]
MLGSVPVVVKSLILKTLTRRVAEDFRREATVLSQLNHPRIVKFFGCIIEPNFSALVLELIHMGSLFDVYLTDAPPEDAVGPVKINMPSFPKRLQFAIDVAEGMQYLHTHKPKPIYHRDLKSMNVLVERDPQTQMLRGKLADFGLALIKTETLSTGLASAHLRDTGEPHFSRGPKGTMLWMAPELNDVHARFSPACDVFSFGVLLTEIASWAGP